MNLYQNVCPRMAVLLCVSIIGAFGITNERAAAQDVSQAAVRGTQPALENPYPRRLEAPELSGGVEWVNVERPLTLASLKGRYVLLDFWTYCCINCMHVLPELKKLEHAYPQELVVIGVHSAKFDGEKVSDNIREAIGRYEIEHPVVNDAEMTIWRKYGTRSWPTLVLIDPEGQVVWAASGERTFEDIKPVIDLGLPYYRETGLLKPQPRPTVITDPAASTMPLRFPGKVLTDAAGGRLFIADSNHNRIVVADLIGGVKGIIGAGGIGASDGAFDQATFHHPQGMALVGETLYIADTENHLLRKADLANQVVTTIAGTGERGSGWPVGDAGVAGGSVSTSQVRFAGRPKTTAIASPWALWPHEKSLYIAMAGPHQVWKMPLDESVIGPFAGNGREDIHDGPLLPQLPYDGSYASFAQPSGLASDGKQMFVADSEGSIIRSVPFDPEGETDSVVGPTGATLFDFGDVDGVGERVRLQHPLGVAWQDGQLFVADTYNNKIKLVDPTNRSCRTIAGTGQPGRADGDGAAATFNEPSGLSIANGKLFIADTNNHAIRVMDLASPYRVSTMTFEGLSPPNKN